MKMFLGFVFLFFFPMTFCIRAEQHTVLNGLLNVCIMCCLLCFLKYITLQLAWGPINDPLFFSFLFFKLFSVWILVLRHIVASSTLQMFLVTFCVKKKKIPLSVCPVRVHSCFQSVDSAQMSMAKCPWMYVLLTNRSVSAILPFLYLWICCALISCCSLLAFRFPQQLCFHTVQSTRAFYRKKNKNGILFNLFLYHSLKICCRRH